MSNPPKSITIPVPESMKDIHQALHPHAQGTSITLMMDDGKVCLKGDQVSHPICLHRDASDNPNVTLLNGQRMLHCNDISSGENVLGRVCWAWK
jgi:hypothetical protein